MQRFHSAVFTFSGRLKPDSLADFVAHRGARLSLDWAILSADAAALRVRVSGPPDLVDAFEMACSLGAGDCLVLDVARQEAGSAQTTADPGCAS